MKLKKKLKKLKELSDNPSSHFPWDVLRVFPNIELGTTGICFSENGDFVSREEAIFALEYLLKELK